MKYILFLIFTYFSYSQILWEVENNYSIDSVSLSKNKTLFWYKTDDEIIVRTLQTGDIFKTYPVSDTLIRINENLQHFYFKSGLYLIKADSEGKRDTLNLGELFSDQNISDYHIAHEFQNNDIFKIRFLGYHYFYKYHTVFISENNLDISEIEGNKYFEPGVFFYVDGELNYISQTIKVCYELWGSDLVKMRDCYKFYNNGNMEDEIASGSIKSSMRPDKINYQKNLILANDFRYLSYQKGGTAGFGNFGSSVFKISKDSIYPVYAELSEGYSTIKWDDFISLDNENHLILNNNSKWVSYLDNIKLAERSFDLRQNGSVLFSISNNQIELVDSLVLTTYSYIDKENKKCISLGNGDFLLSGGGSLQYLSTKDYLNVHHSTFSINDYYKLGDTIHLNNLYPHDNHWIVNGKEIFEQELSLEADLSGIWEIKLISEFDKSQDTVIRTTRVCDTTNINLNVIVEGSKVTAKTNWDNEANELNFRIKGPSNSFDRIDSNGNRIIENAAPGFYKLELMASNPYKNQSIEKSFSVISDTISIFDEYNFGKNNKLSRLKSFGGMTGILHTSGAISYFNQGSLVLNQHLIENGNFLGFDIDDKNELTYLVELDNLIIVSKINRNGEVNSYHIFKDKNLPELANIPELKLFNNNYALLRAGNHYQPSNSFDYNYLLNLNYLDSIDISPFISPLIGHPVNIYEDWNDELVKSKNYDIKINRSAFFDCLSGEFPSEYILNCRYEASQNYGGYYTKQEPANSYKNRVNYINFNYIDSESSNNFWEANKLVYRDEKPSHKPSFLFDIGQHFISIDGERYSDIFFDINFINETPTGYVAFTSKSGNYFIMETDNQLMPTNVSRLDFGGSVLYTEVSGGKLYAAVLENGDYKLKYLDIYDYTPPLTANENNTIKSIIYPNPANSFIGFGDFLYKRIKVFNIFGDVVIDCDYQKIIDISKVSNGVYFVKFFLGNEVVTEKFIKF